MARESHQGISEQAKAAKHRRDDAQALFDAGRWRGAMYLAGYSVECLLKVKLMQRFGTRTLRELEDELQRRGVTAAGRSVFTHGLEHLLRMAGGWERMRQSRETWAAFAVVNSWLPAWRYTADLSNSDVATAFLAAVDRVVQWVENNV